MKCLLFPHRDFDHVSPRKDHSDCRTSRVPSPSHEPYLRSPSAWAACIHAFHLIASSLLRWQYILARSRPRCVSHAAYDHVEAISLDYAHPCPALLPHRHHRQEHPKVGKERLSRRSLVGQRCGDIVKSDVRAI
jgi:hypothetical protein